MSLLDCFCNIVSSTAWHILNGMFIDQQPYQEGFPGWRVWKPFHTNNNRRAGIFIAKTGESVTAWQLSLDIWRAIYFETEIILFFWVFGGRGLRTTEYVCDTHTCVHVHTHACRLELYDDGVVSIRWWSCNLKLDVHLSETCRP